MKSTIPLLENSIVTGAVVCAERQAGCVRYSFLPLAGSQPPPRFRCQPEASVEAWMLPAFTSRTPGQPGYLQLADATPAQISSGAEDGDEMGVFYGLYCGRRESNLRYRLHEYLRIGLEAGIIHAS